MEEKKKQIETEHSVVELTGAPLDSLDNRPSFTRKLRRRQNDPVSWEYFAIFLLGIFLLVTFWLSLAAYILRSLSRVISYPHGCVFLLSVL